jgi:hypothetical protein
MSAHASSKKEYNPTYNQLDNYAIAMNNIVQFDSDSAPIKVDNCYTQSITGYKSDFIASTLKNVSNLHAIGFGNSKTPISQMGTVQWVVTDDIGIRRDIIKGIHRDIIIPNTYYIPNCSVRLLSPQHWGQEVQDDFPQKNGTWCATFDDRVILRCCQRK